MPYKTIHWIKLELRLLNDHRFFLMSELAQLYYVKILLLCAACGNNIPRDIKTLKELLRAKCTETELELIIKEITLNFPKVKLNDKSIYIEEFSEHHNYIDKGIPKEIPGKSQGSPRVVADKIRIDKKREDKNREPKILFSDCVYLTNKELNELSARFGEQGAKDRIKALNDYMMAKGKQKEYKSHYHTILSWERKNNPEIKPKNEGAGGRYL